MQNEEIARLTDALELANSRHHRLIKPRHASHDSSSRPITPPPGHHRSSSISSHIGYPRENKVPFTKQSPSSSPVHKTQTSLPSTTTTAPGAADISMTSSIGSGSTTLNPPSLGKSHKKSRQRLSSILGIHLGTPEKDK